MAMVLGACMLGTAVTGCSKEIPVEEETTQVQESSGAQTDTGEAVSELVPEEGAQLTFWTTDIEFGQAVAAKFEEKYGVPVTAEEVGLDAVNKVLLDGPAGNGPDIFMVAHDSFETGYSAGIFQQIDDTVAQRLNEELSPIATPTVTRDGKMWGVPVSIESTALLYNKELVTEPAQTMEQILEECKTFNNPSENKFWFVAACTAGYGGYPFLSANGFQLFGPDGSDDDNPGFDTEEFVGGLEMIAELGQSMGLKAADLAMENTQMLDQNFIDGNVGYYAGGPWSVDAMVNAGVDVGVVPFPTYKGKSLTPFAGVQNAHISAYTEYPNASQLFIEYLVSDESAELLYSEANKITSRKDIESVAGLCDDEVLKVFAQQFEDAVPMPSSKRMSYYWTITESVLSAVFDGDLTPEEGAKKAQTDFEALVASE